MAWDNENKDWSYEKPFHRVASPFYHETVEAFTLTLPDGRSVNVPLADGKGFKCGCRALHDFPSLGARRDLLIKIGQLLAKSGDPKSIIHAVPGWVPVLHSDDVVTNPIPFEIEGELIRSFQTWTDVPVWQWHRWFDWNFHIFPAAGYKYVRGEANKAPKIEKKPGEKPRTPLITDDVMECEWDCGAFGEKPGVMFTGDNAGSGMPEEARPGDVIDPSGNPDLDDPHWFWPMTGQYFWASGRWIYDCGHANPAENSKNPPVQNRMEECLMRTELHPMRAMATARWEAVKFEENGDRFVPAIQFMFFISRTGGYKAWPVINDQDYEFIVDLPELDVPQSLGWTIGRTEDFPFNTGVFRRPHLLRKIRFLRLFNRERRRGAVQPEITEIPATEPGMPPKQVRIKIPCTQLPAAAEYFGIMISLGWFDPAKTASRKVKKVTFEWDKIVTGENPHGGSTGEWMLRLCVNGRWLHSPLYEGVGKNDTLTKGLAGKKLTFYLGERDDIRVSVHGEEFDPVGNWMREHEDSQRTLRVDCRDVDWELDVVNRANDPDRLAGVLGEFFDLLLWTFGKQNQPLGIIDPRHGPPEEKNNNPLKVKGLVVKNRKLSLTAFDTAEVGELAELAFDDGVVDYRVHYTITVEPQQVD